ncbi:MAG TPA: phosphatase PAP2 family protein [Clostridiales bacterium]|nr:phosphatase PAP2 family protein [Clostridiales bacterium]
MLTMVQHWDETALVWIAQNLRIPVLNEVMIGYTTLGNAGLGFILVTVLLLCFRRTRRAGAAAGVSMALGLVVTNLTVKPLVERARPWVVMEGFEALVKSADPHSFPSGHSCAAFAFGVALAMALPQRWAKVLALAAAVLMAFSRLYVGVHFPSDVAAGSLIGAVCGVAGVGITRWASRLGADRPAVG